MIEFRGKRYQKSTLMSAVTCNSKINVAFTDFVVLLWDSVDYTNKNLTGKRGKQPSSREKVDADLLRETLGKYSSLFVI